MGMTPAQTSKALTLGGAAATLVSLVAPWATATNGLSDASSKGLDNPDAKWLAGAAILAGALVVGTVATVAARRAAVTIAFLLGGAIFADGVRWATRVKDFADGFDDAEISVGWGLYLTVASGAVIVLGSIMALSEAMKTPIEPAPLAVMPSTPMPPPPPPWPTPGASNSQR